MIHIYVSEIDVLDKEEVFKEKLDFVHTQRRMKVLRCKNTEDKKRSLMAGLLLRRAIENENLNYETLGVTEGAYGKPLYYYQTKNGERVSIGVSISHAKDKVAVAFSLDETEFGIDIENMNIRFQYTTKDMKRLDSVLSKCMSKKEGEYYQNLSGEYKETIDYAGRLWTRKEAYAKTTGVGLGMDFSRIETIEDENSKVHKFETIMMDGYHLSIYNGKGSIEYQLHILC
ncbi:MAG: 4'-phosphopantetheinyl transferase superfamily protein [Agathobacter sp.]|nr:4'-phosphopantetheinyl transferase superfamily protein [Agathobacter sp.]